MLQHFHADQLGHCRASPTSGGSVSATVLRAPHSDRLTLRLVAKRSEPAQFHQWPPDRWLPQTPPRFTPLRLPAGAKPAPGIPKDDGRARPLGMRQSPNSSAGIPASYAVITRTRAAAQLACTERIPPESPAHLVPLPEAAKSEGPAAGMGSVQSNARTLSPATTSDHSSVGGPSGMTRVTLVSRVQESRMPGSVRAKAEWLSYSTVTH